MRRMTAAALLFATLLLPGCGGEDFGPLGSVKGKLTMDGEPLAAGTQLLFMDVAKGTAPFGATDKDGNYSLIWAREGERRPDFPIGTFKILIQPPATETDTEDMSADELLDGGGDGKKPSLQFPAKYRSHATSGLEFTVKEGENTHDIDLKSS